MIDSDGYRPNVGIIISNGKGQVMWAKRYGQNSWQFPQGGINTGETAEEAMYRELYEEVGLQQSDVKILAVSRVWLRYKLPKRMVRWDSKPLCIGQKQRWFLLELISKDDAVNMIGNTKPEFDGFRWVTFWYPIRQVVAFKRDVYRRALKEFAPYVLAQQSHDLKDEVTSITVKFDKKWHYSQASASISETSQQSSLTPQKKTSHAVTNRQSENLNNLSVQNTIEQQIEQSETAQIMAAKTTDNTPNGQHAKSKKRGRRWPKRFKKKSSD